MQMALGWKVSPSSQSSWPLSPSPSAPRQEPVPSPAAPLPSGLGEFLAPRPLPSGLMAAVWLLLLPPSICLMAPRRPFSRRPCYSVSASMANSLINRKTALALAPETAGTGGKGWMGEPVGGKTLASPSPHHQVSSPPLTPIPNLLERPHMPPPPADLPSTPEGMAPWSPFPTPVSSKHTAFLSLSPPTSQCWVSCFSHRCFVTP